MAPCRLTCTSVQTTWPKQTFCIIMAHAEFLVQGYQIYQKTVFFHMGMHKSEVPFCKYPPTSGYQWRCEAPIPPNVRQWHSDSWDSCRLRHLCENKFMHIWLDILGILHTSKSDRIANCQYREGPNFRICRQIAFPTGSPYALMQAQA